MPRVKADIKECLKFVGKNRNGCAARRRDEILTALTSVYQHPKARRVALRRPSENIDLRVHHVAQFVIIYAYFEPNAVMQNGIVSIRAIRHRRVGNPFHGVREPVAHYLPDPSK